MREIRTANIRYRPDVSNVLPWNVGLYDIRCADEYGDPYIESVGATDHANAIAIADAWVNCREEEFNRLIRW